ncbi:MAG: LysR family transcriptional regulator, partial [Bacilli bacterium]
MDLTSLTTFIAVVEQGNFTRAAEVLNRSQPSVTMHIRQLETEIGATLFARGGRKVTPTVAGHTLYKRAKQMISLHIQTLQELHDLKAGAFGTIRIAASYTVGELLVPHMMAWIHEQFPEINLSLFIGNTEQVEQQVLFSEADVSFFEGQWKEASLSPQVFVDDEMILCAHPSVVARNDENGVQVLQHQTWLVREAGSGTRAHMEHVMHAIGITPRAFIP